MRNLHKQTFPCSAVPNKFFFFGCFVLGLAVSVFVHKKLVVSIISCGLLLTLTHISKPLGWVAKFSRIVLFQGIFICGYFYFYLYFNGGKSQFRSLLRVKAIVVEDQLLLCTLTHILIQKPHIYINRLQIILLTRTQEVDSTYRNIFKICKTINSDSRT